MVKSKFSKDPKVRLVSIEDFLQSNNYLFEAEKNLWKNKKPKKWKTYYKFTANLLISVEYGVTCVNFGMDSKEHLECITVAYRDGKTEYDLFTQRMLFLTEKECEKDSNYNLEIANLRHTMELLPQLFPKYETIPKESVKRTFQDYLFDTGYRTNPSVLKKKCVVIDVETNGVRTSKDDLLSLSIYDPISGLCYNRFFPLDLQPLVLTTYIHGITEETLEQTTHMTQEELNEIIEYFDLNNSIVLSYSGGRGRFDVSTLINYCKRHRLIGLENLKCDNIKKYVPQSFAGLEGQLTKDNLCKLLKIKGVRAKHTGLNDCVLEWKLFEKLCTENLFFIQENLFKYNPSYIIPISILNESPVLQYYLNHKIPTIGAKISKVFTYKFPKHLLSQIQKFPRNITGVTFEHALNVLLEAELQNNVDFLRENKKQLEYMGALNHRSDDIPVSFNDDGTIKALDSTDEFYVEQINAVTKTIMENIAPLVEYIKNNIFSGENILSQEMVITENKILALCDLSSEKSILEIKTFNCFDGCSLQDAILRQLYYQAKGRLVYLLMAEFVGFEEMSPPTLTFTIYKVALEAKEGRTHILSDLERTILDLMIQNDQITAVELAKHLGVPTTTIKNELEFLKFINYIEQVDANARKHWNVLKTTRKVTYDPTADIKDVYLESRSYFAT